MFQRLKLQYDEPHLDFAFNFNLRCYTKENRVWYEQDENGVGGSSLHQVGRLNPVAARFERECFHLLELKFDEPLSNFPLRIMLRRSNQVSAQCCEAGDAELGMCTRRKTGCIVPADTADIGSPPVIPPDIWDAPAVRCDPLRDEVRRCRLTLSNSR
jgi:hypothetical protein